MPVRKFRSPEEAEQSLWRAPGDPAIWESAVRRWRVHCFLRREPPRPRTPGVFRYASIDAKQRHRP